MAASFSDPYASRRERGEAVLVPFHFACPWTRFASTVNTEPRLTPLANTTVSKIARICFPLLTSTPSIVDVRTTLPELSAAPQGLISTAACSQSHEEEVKLR